MPPDAVRVALASRLHDCRLWEMGGWGSRSHEIAHIGRFDLEDPKGRATHSHRKWAGVFPGVNEQIGH